MQRLASFVTKLPCQRATAPQRFVAFSSESITVRKIKIPFTPLSFSWLTYITRSFSFLYFNFKTKYSGGHASEGQGGFYSSGGAARAPEIIETKEGMIALAADVEKISNVMKELESLEEMLENESDPASGRSIEIKAGMKKIMTQPEVIQSLDRLEVQGQPVWGLSVQERELIQLARELVNAC